MARRRWCAGSIPCSERCRPVSSSSWPSRPHLQTLPVDAIKIDQSFVVAMTDRNASAAIVRAAVDLGHDLGLQVVAEGVENKIASERVKALACDVAQGYYVAKPMPAGE